MASLARRRVCAVSAHGSSCSVSSGRVLDILVLRRATPEKQQAPTLMRQAMCRRAMEGLQRDARREWQNQKLTGQTIE
jgi:hypothetical protein